MILVDFLRRFNTVLKKFSKKPDKLKTKISPIFFKIPSKPFKRPLSKSFDPISSNTRAFSFLTRRRPKNTCLPRLKKPQPKNEEQFDLFGSAIQDDSSEETRHQYYNSLENTEHSYQIIQGDLGLRLLLQNLQNQSSVCFDTETTGLDANNVELVGLSFSYKVSEGYYIPVSHNFDEAQALVNEFKPIFENGKISKIGQNIKYDMSVLKWYGIEIKGKLFDTMIAHFLIQPEMRHNMNVLAETYLGYSPVSIETLIGKKGILVLVAPKLPKRTAS